MGAEGEGCLPGDAREEGRAAETLYAAARPVAAATATAARHDAAVIATAARPVAAAAAAAAAVAAAPVAVGSADPLAVSRSAYDSLPSFARSQVGYESLLDRLGDLRERIAARAGDGGFWLADLSTSKREAEAILNVLLKLGVALPRVGGGEGRAPYGVVALETGAR